MMKIILRFIIIFLITVFIQPLPLLADSQALFEQGMEAFKSNNFGSSELLFRKIIEEDDEYKDRAWFYLALSIFNQKKYKSAIFELNRFLTICNTSDLCSQSRYWIAEAYYLLKDYINSIEEFKRFISQSKNDTYIAFAYDRIGRVYFNQNRYEEAIIEWMKALSRDKDKSRNNQRRLDIGEAEFLNEKYDEAIELLKNLVIPGIDERITAKARLIIGRAYQIKKRHRKALRAFKAIPDSLLKESPFYDVQYYRALSYLELGKTNSAKVHLESFLLIGQESEWLLSAKFELGKILLNEKKEKEAIAFLEEVRSKAAASGLKSKSAMILGKVYIHNKDMGNAVKYLEEAASLDAPEEKKEAMLLLSNAYIQLKKYKEAESILKQLINKYSYDKDNDYIQFLLGRLYLEQGDMEKAILGFDKIKEINPFSRYLDESYYYLGLANIKNRQKQKAIELLNKYLSINKPKMKYDAYVHLLYLYIEMNNFKKAGGIIKRITRYYLDKEGVEEVLYKYGLALKENGYSERKHFNLIVKKFYYSGAASKVYLLWGDEAFIKKDYKKAERYYRHYLNVKEREHIASVFLYRIISLYKLGRYNDIIALSRKKDIPSVNYYTSKQLSLWLGRCYFQKGEYELAYNTLYKWRLSDYSSDDLLIIVKCGIKVEDVTTAREASKLLQNDKKLYAESLYDLGIYYYQKEDYDGSMGYFSRIIIECPSSEFENYAKAEIAGIYIRKERYKEAIAKLKEIKKKEIRDKKNAMLIICNFKTGEEKSAIALTKKNMKRLMKLPLGEEVMRENVLYYYRAKNIKEFKAYAWSLDRFSGNKSFINYLTGKLYFDQKKYKSSYYYFYKLVNVKSQYIEEALYYIGLISLLKYRNQERAIRYFTRLSEEKGHKGEFSMKGKLYLSILTNEKGEAEKSKKILQDILNSNENKLFKIQAQNLLEYYGYAE